MIEISMVQGIKYVELIIENMNIPVLNLVAEAIKVCRYSVDSYSRVHTFTNLVPAYHMVIKFETEEARATFANRFIKFYGEVFNITEVNKNADVSGTGTSVHPEAATEADNAISGV